MNSDVIVIGGGLAGLALSIDLRKRGYSVVVIEKGSYPRQKVCGEYISMESKRYLYALCPALEQLRLPEISSFRLSSTGDKELVTGLGMGGFGISRYLLEELLYKEALAQGVHFILDTKATEVTAIAGMHYRVRTHAGSFEARLVCNASGRRSNLEVTGRKTKNIASNYIGIKYHVRLERKAEQIEIHNFPGGYCGISNVEEGKACLCYIVNAKMLSAVNRSIPELEEKVLSRNGNLAAIFKNAEFISREPVSISGINFLIKQPFDDTVFFLGDSAGSIAPVTGNGMSMALRSAFMLANFADLYLSGKLTREELTRRYADFWQKEFSLRIRLSRSFQKLSEFPFLTRISIALFNFFPSLAKAVIRRTHGQPF